MTTISLKISDSLNTKLDRLSQEMERIKVILFVKLLKNFWKKEKTTLLDLRDFLRKKKNIL